MSQSRSFLDRFVAATVAAVLAAAAFSAASAAGAFDDSTIGVEAADLDRDGRVDLATANIGDSVSFLRGRGRIRPARGIPREVPGRHGGVAVGDLNADGLPDVVTEEDLAAEGVQVLLNEGFGRLGEPTFYGLRGSWDMELSDLNGDGRLDVVVVALSPLDEALPGRSRVSVFSGLGDGRLGEPQHYYAADAETLATGDVDADGDIDVVVAAEPRLLLLRNGGGGILAQPRQVARGRIDEIISDMLLRDLNRDGNLDLAWIDYTWADRDRIGRAVSVARGDGRGGFARPRTFPGVPGAWDLVAARLNGDRRVDLAVASSDRAVVAVLVNAGDGRYRVRTRAATGAPASALTAADIDGDRRTDLVAGLTSRPAVSVLRGLGDGRFGRPVQTATGPACVVPRLRGLRLANARRRIAAGNCDVGRIRSAPSTTARRGRVLRQKPSPSSVFSVGWRVDLVIGSRSRARVTD